MLYAAKSSIIDPPGTGNASRAGSYDHTHPNLKTFNRHSYLSGEGGGAGVITIFHGAVLVVVSSAAASSLSSGDPVTGITYPLSSSPVFPCSLHIPPSSPSSDFLPESIGVAIGVSVGMSLISRAIPPSGELSSICTHPEIAVGQSIWMLLRRLIGKSPPQLEIGESSPPRCVFLIEGFYSAGKLTTSRLPIL